MSDQDELIRRFDVLEESFREHRAEVRQDSDKLWKAVTELNHTASMGRGAVQMLLWIGGIVGALGTVIFTFLNYLKH